MGREGTGGRIEGKKRDDRRKSSSGGTDSKRKDCRKAGGRENTGGRRIIKNYTGEVTAKEMRIKILKLLMDDQERGIV